MPEKSLCCNFITNVSAWTLLNTTGTLTRTMFYGQMKLQLSFLTTNTQGGFGLKKIMPTFQLDNDAKDTSRSTQKWLTEHIIKLLQWSSQSPDLTCRLSWRGEWKREDLGLWMIWRDSVKRNGLRFLSLYCTILLDVTAEDPMLFYWEREVV